MQKIARKKKRGEIREEKGRELKAPCILGARDGIIVHLCETAHLPLP